MKKIYFKPETTNRNLFLENVMSNLSPNGDDTWSQTIGDDDETADDEDEGRAKGRGLWEEGLW